MRRTMMRWDELCADIAARDAASVLRADRSAIVLGRNKDGAAVFLPRRPRMEHTHVIGTTGGGKTTFLSHCIRQDIARRCGVLVVDPHGEHPDSMYRSLLAWLDIHGYAESRTIHLIDPNAPTHTVGFNPLARPDADTDISVIAGVTLEAFSRAWGGEDTTQKPTIERVLTATFAALAELGFTLAEAPFLLDRRDRHGLRAFAIKNITDRYTRDELQRLHELSLDDRRRHDFDLEIVGPVNRLARFLRPTAIRAMIGQTERIFDFRDALDGGHVVLCNLSGGARVYERDADLLGRLLIRSLFFHAKRRRAPDRPFFVYLDECHRYLSGDLESILGEVRKFGCGVVLSHQWQAQMAVESENMLAAVRNATNLKVVFRIKDAEEAEELAHAVVPLDLEMPVRSLIKPAVIGHRSVRLKSESTGESTSTNTSRSQMSGDSESESDSYSTSAANTTARGINTTESSSESTGESTSRTASRSLGIAEGVSNSVNNNISIGEGTSHVHASGSADGTSTTGTMLPLGGDFFEVPTVLTVSDGATSTSNSSQASGMNYSTAASSGTSTGTSASKSSAAGLSIGTAASRSRTIGFATGKSTTHAMTLGSTQGRAHSRGRNHATTISSGDASGRTSTYGTAEAFEPLYTELPTAMHSKENVLYMAAQSLRNLPTGVAYINYVGQSGMVPVLLTVPRISEHPLSAEAFASLRERVLSRSSAATPIEEAILLVSNREQKMLDARRKAEEIPEPETFRTTAPPSAVARERSRPAAASPGRARKVSHDKRHVR